MKLVPALLAAGLLAACTPSAPPPPPAASPPAAPAKPPAAVVPLGLPYAVQPAAGAAGTARVELGSKLFADRRLSFRGDVACATCHIPGQGFTSTRAGVAIGTGGEPLRRNAPTLLNVAYHTSLFRDGRETTLEHQVWGPLLSAAEMGNPSIGLLVERLRSLEDYEGLFERAFDGRGPGMETIALAIAAYERTLVSANSRFDRWYYGKDAGALDATEQAGFAVFTGKGRCITCHTVYPTHTLFSDMRFHNTGTRQGRRAGTDPGRYGITGNPADRGAFKTPMLRDVALTAPYMHDGSLATLEQVVDFYDRGGNPDPNLSKLMTPLGLTVEEKRALVAFLRSLTGTGAAVEAAQGSAGGG